MAMFTALFRRPAGKQVTWHPHSHYHLSLLSLLCAGISPQVQRQLKLGRIVSIASLVPETHNHLLSETPLDAGNEAGETAIVMQ